MRKERIKLIFILSCLICSIGLSAQDNSGVKESIFQGTVKVKTSGRKFTFAYAKGDKVSVNMTERKDKKLKSLILTDLTGNKVWSKENISAVDEVISIPKDGVYSFEFKAKTLGSRDISFNVSRESGKDGWNICWERKRITSSSVLDYTVDSLVGYKEPVVSIQEMKLFDRYATQTVPMLDVSSQVLGQMGVHNSQAKGYSLAVDRSKIPSNAKLKNYVYTLSSKLGGATHWKIAEAAVMVGSMVLSPVGAFAANGAMSVIGPKPGNEPVQYFMSTRQSDIDAVKKMYSPSNTAKGATNSVANGINSASNFLFGKKAVGKKKIWGDGDLDYKQKGQVTDLFVSSRSFPKEKWFIIANLENTQAKNFKLSGYAIYYAPIYKSVKSEEYYYEAEVVKLDRSATKYSQEVVYQSIK